jgi:biotin-dependent carboxylase-like uncharacterized protein
MSATLTILRPGLRTLVVDAGRPRSRSLGVPVGGAADRFALGVGNALVGNAPEDAALEIALAGPVLVADAPLACVVYGAPFEVHAGGRSIPAGTTFTLEAGKELSIGGTPVGVRAYLCIRGGIDAPVVLGSRSGLTPPAAGVTLACHAGRIAGRALTDTHPMIHDAPGPAILHTLPGGQATWFPPDALSSRTFRVGPASDRMGLRLGGEPLPVPPEMASEPVCPGTVQVTRDGRCIVLGVDGQTIGGYPKVAQVVAADLDRLGQLRPGVPVAFREVCLEEAARMWRRRCDDLAGRVLRLRETLALALRGP